MSFPRSPEQLLPRQGGITLLEALAVLAIMGILLAMALPSMRAFVIQNRLAAESRLLIAALTLARSEAVKRGRAVKVCRSSTADAGGARCSAAASGDRDGADWAAGWLVLEADNGQILLRQGALGADTQAPASRATITYHAGGDAGSSYTNVEFSHKGEFARMVCVAGSGRIRLKSDGSKC
ncbi:GspH/FimT family pseudopilin [Collimonas humicola]|uniref:GspH/FimT family pseudopilin n=1 Tax=Collimonas humicola TaxID=2825886 RepID=UPI001B8ADAAB|nr:GspH/FimT family pseudopilin [Collimonas humicola]